MDELSHSLHNHCVSNLQVLCRLEGAAAAMYFEAYQQIFPADFKFNGRHRRPPPDPVNALLSLCYTLIHHEAVNALKMYGLDPMLGFYHQPYYGRDSLA
jgi:CRISP-associated protein Cas1